MNSARWGYRFGKSSIKKLTRYDEIDVSHEADIIPTINEPG